MRQFIESVSPSYVKASALSGGAAVTGWFVSSLEAIGLFARTVGACAFSAMAVATLIWAFIDRAKKNRNANNKTDG